VNQEEAREALAILRNIVARTRDDSALQNWGLIWMIHGVTNGVGFCLSGWLLQRGVVDIAPHLGLWIGILCCNFWVILLARRKKRGVATFVERQLWSIWMTFLGGVYLTAGINQLMGLRIFFLIPVVAILAAIALAMMGSVIDRFYYVGAAVFSVVALLMGWLPEYALYLFGATWCLSQFSMGLNLHRQKLRLAASPGRIV
jgi:hypothetical protein